MCTTISTRLPNRRPTWLPITTYPPSHLPNSCGWVDRQAGDVVIHTNYKFFKKLLCAIDLVVWIVKEIQITDLAKWINATDKDLHSMQIWTMLTKNQITFWIQKAVDFHTSLLLQWGLQYHTLDQQNYYKSHAENNKQTRNSLKNWKVLIRSAYAIRTIANPFQSFLCYLQGNQSQDNANGRLIEDNYNLLDM